MASSLVGVIISVWIPLTLYLFSIAFSKIGIKKANVFPEPVQDSTATS